MRYVLIVNHISKIYYTHKSEVKRILSWFNLAKKPKEKHGILKDVSFSVTPGEVVGIVGSNGAGKSSLLKIIAGTLYQTNGDVIVNGSVSAILELGMGFHPELSGRQNAINTAQLMGHTIGEDQVAISDIENFADIGEYFDLPVRSYSSGMQVRVAFAVATAFRPDLLIIDEALSVGDASFQRKCFRKIEEFQKKGTAMLFVSHDIETVKRICSKAIFIKNGKLIESGKAKKVCDMYEQYMHSAPEDIQVNEDLGQLSSYGDNRAIISNVRLQTADGSSKYININEVFSLNFNVRFLENVVRDVGYSIMIKTKEGVSVFGTDTESVEKNDFSGVSGKQKQISFSITNYLAPNTYYVSCGVYQMNNGVKTFLNRQIDIINFNINLSNLTTVVHGLVDLNAAVIVEDIA
jgi:lipopolysaccharide transport system ATP-binding protein